MGVSPRGEGGRQRKEEGEICGHGEGEETEEKKRKGKNHCHQNQFSSKKKKFHQNPLSSKTNFIKNHFHQKTTSIKNQFHQRPLSSETTFKTNPTEGGQDKIRLGAKNNTVRISVKSSPADGRRRFHRNTACCKSDIWLFSNCGCNTMLVQGKNRVSKMSAMHKPSILAYLKMSGFTPYCILAIFGPLFFSIFLHHNEFWPFFGPLPSPLTFHNVNNHGSKENCQATKKTKKTAQDKQKENNKENTGGTNNIVRVTACARLGV